MHLLCLQQIALDRCKFLTMILFSNNLFVADLWNESQASMKKSKKRGSMGISVGAGGDFGGDRRRKPVSVSGPYIVYMLKDMDIIDDWTAIKKVQSMIDDFGYL